MNHGTNLISLYKDVYDSTSNHVATVDDIIGAIYNGRWEDKIELIRNAKNDQWKTKYKNALPCVTFSGSFSKRNSASLINYSYLMTLDIDTGDKEVAKRIKNKLCASKYIFTAFYSPSGGVKALVKVDCDPEHHKRYVFPIIQRHIEGVINHKIDDSGKNIDRLCFVSFDDDLHYNPDSDIYHVDVDGFIEADTKRRADQLKKIQASGASVCYDSSKIFNRCVEWTYKSEGYHKGNRNNFVHQLACNLNRFGIQATETEILIMGRFPSLGHEELTRTVDGVYKRNRSEFGTKQMYAGRKSKSLFDD